MFRKTETVGSVQALTAEIKRLKHEIESAEAILIGAGAGVSTAAGLTYTGERFARYFSDFREQYGIRDMYAGGFYPFASLEEYWAWWSRHIYINRYAAEVGKPYQDLLHLVQERNYFVLTTNVDHQFQLAGFEKERLFYTQGDYGLFQCARGCHLKTYDNEELIRNMVAQQKNMKIPTSLVPRCPVCGAPMTVHLRIDDTFVQDAGWYAAQVRYEDFIRRQQDAHILYLELGVGNNTPVIIKYPFWRMTAQNQNAVYACVNNGETACPGQIAQQAILLHADIGEVLAALLL